MTRKRQKIKRTRTGQKKSNKWLYIAIPILAILLAGVGGTWLLVQGDADSTGDEIELAPVSQLSDKVRAAPPLVQEAYRFAIANPEILSQLPCYCGCGNMGHESDLDCFVKEFNPDGTVAVFGYHAYE
jgi:hypothetical protein